ncbi:MAG: DUF1343 domain-containing protein [Kofleriaceae bacterium]
MIPVEGGGAGVTCDAVTGAPVYSLYGHTTASLSPTPAMLEQVDVVPDDVQDVGSRYYTFVWTMVLAMRAAAAAGKRFVVLDRPNPIGGALVEGGAIAPGYDSFVGLVSCANRHGLTAGEIAAWRLAEERLDLELAVVPMRGWRRDHAWADTGLLWVMPSPNMPTVDTALVYPGMCLVEGNRAVGGAGHHPAVRARRRPRPRSRAAGRHPSRRWRCLACGSARWCSRCSSRSTPAGLRRRAAARRRRARVPAVPSPASPS